MKFCHIADTHIRNLRYHKEYRAVFDQLYQAIKQENVDYIIHCGDIAHTKTQISPEFVDMCYDFLSSLADIAPTYVILGNHDGNLKNTGRMDALTPIVEAAEHPDLHLLKDSQEVYLRNGFTLNVLSVFDEKGWSNPSNYDNVNIALYHGSISNCQTDSGWVMENGEHEVGIFEEFDYAFLGDIHKAQAMDRLGKIRYAGSTIQQGFGETEDKGVLIWDIQDRHNFTVKPIIFQNPKPFVTVELQNGKVPKVDVQDGARIRIVSNESITLENMKKAVDVAQHKFRPESITFLNRNIGRRSLTDDTVEDIHHDDLRDIVVQRRLIKEFLADYQLSDNIMSNVLELNDKYNLMAEEKEEVMRNVNWKVRSLKFDNLFNYGEDNSIDFANLNGVVGVFGKNYTGKSSIIDSLLYTMYNTTSKNERKNLNVINFDKDYGCGNLELLTEDGTVWTIYRQSDKYQKKSKGQQITEAKTDVRFTSVAIDGTESVHNSLTRNETDKEIRKTFGTIDDFLLTSMSSQLDALSFIREGSTKRKEIFAKFLDLELFDRKFKFAKSEASTLRGALKRMEGKEYAADIDKALYDLQECSSDHERKQEEVVAAAKLVKSLEQQLRALQEAIDNTPTELIDIEGLRSKLGRAIREKKRLRKETGDLSVKSATSQRLIGEIQTFLDGVDLTEHEETLKKASNLRELILEIDSALRDLKSEQKRNERQSCILVGIPCGSSYPACKFIKDANMAKKRVPINAENQQLLEEKKGEHVKSLNLLDVARARKAVDDCAALRSRKQEHERSIDKSGLIILKNKALIETLDTKINTLTEKEQEYLLNKDAVDNLANLIAEKNTLKRSVDSAEKNKQELYRQVRTLNKRLGSLEQKVENLRFQQAELIKLQEEYSAYDLYLKCMHSNGIAYDIIKSKLPTINDEISKFLMGIVDFSIYFEDDGKRLNIHIQHPEQDARPLEMGSGAEKTIAAMAIRLALLSVSNLPKGDIFILDEPGTALDEENLEGFTRMLGMIKCHFKTVLLVSHLETLKDCVDIQICIEQKDGHAFVNC